ncbi:MAG: hypothetical protein JO262_04215 [Solirubrobacterales bacterium]|nr:hypothetical protein [Solirubrobacterales bacterium]MBV9941314.1 hypothetical protein [Solirubrobacterales bacterium]
MNETQPETTESPAPERTEGPDKAESRVARVKSLGDYFAERGMDPGDEFVGPESGRHVLDYGGEPEVLADSRDPQDRREYEEAAYQGLRELIEA